MIKIILFTLFVFGIFFFGINTLRTMSGKEKLQLTRLISYSIICAVLTVTALIGFVLVF